MSSYRSVSFVYHKSLLSETYATGGVGSSWPPRWYIIGKFLVASNRKLKQKQIKHWRQLLFHITKRPKNLIQQLNDFKALVQCLRNSLQFSLMVARCDTLNCCSRLCITTSRDMSRKLYLSRSSLSFRKPLQKVLFISYRPQLYHMFMPKPMTWSWECDQRDQS